MRTVWLASYPKSGNTWMRLLIAALSLEEDKPLDINAIPHKFPIASARGPFDDFTLIDSGLLTHDEIDALRPAVHEAQARGTEADGSEHVGRFVKTHDAYTLLPDGTPLLAGARGASGAVLIVRDPRGVAPSFANHYGMDIDRAISRMADPVDCVSGSTGRGHVQLRQCLLGWSGFNASWLDQRDLPVLLIRYEDMIADAASALARVVTFAELAPEPDRIARAVAMASFGELTGQESANGFAESPRKMSGRFFRRGEAGAWRDELTLEQIAQIERAHGAMMTRLGYRLANAHRAPAEPSSHDGGTYEARR